MAPRKPKINPDVPQQTETSVDSIQSEAPQKVKDVKVGKFAGKVYAFYHPFQKVPIPAGGDGVTLELDSWLRAQIDAGHIVKL